MPLALQMFAAFHVGRIRFCSLLFPIVFIRPICTRLRSHTHWPFGWRLPVLMALRRALNCIWCIHSSVCMYNMPRASFIFYTFPKRFVLFSFSFFSVSLVEQNRKRNQRIMDEVSRCILLLLSSFFHFTPSRFQHTKRKKNDVKK